ncbi:MAG: Ig-like domain-containing protein [Lachnospiraceae bacterium]|nr:Ig-like domain-containing protein [Lachnospiraceae bacterium]
MNKKIYALMLCMILLFTSAVTVSAASNTKMSKSQITIGVKQTYNLKISNNKNKVKWSSSKKSVATVNSKGKVTGKKKGTTVITAKVGKSKYKCKVVVKKPVLSKKAITLNTNKSYKLKLLYNSKKVRWTSNKKSVSTVNSNGKVVGKKKGSAIITAAVGNAKYRCKVTVKGMEDSDNLEQVYDGELGICTCGYRTKDYKKMDEHLTESQHTFSSDYARYGYEYKCPDCDFQTKVLFTSGNLNDPKTIYGHMRTCHNRDSGYKYKCIFCGCITDDEDNMIKHVEEAKHTDTSYKEYDGQLYKCDYQTYNYAKRWAHYDKFATHRCTWWSTYTYVDKSEVLPEKVWRYTMSECLACGYLSPDIDEFEMHILHNGHNCTSFEVYDYRKKRDDLVEDKTELVCDYCKYATSSLNVMNKHILDKHDPSFDI